MGHHVSVWLAALVIVAGAWVGNPALVLAGEPNRDAAEYAAMFGVTIGEAARRLQLQSAIADLGVRLETVEQTTFAGMWIEHRPFRVVARFTAFDPSRLAPHVRGGPLESISTSLSAQYTLSDLRADLSRFVVAGNRPFDAGINVVQNRIDVETTSVEALSRWMEAHGVIMPSSARVTIVPSLPGLTTDIYGGLEINGSGCTSGFGVVDAGGTRGITTAAHCSNTNSYLGVDLPFVSENFGGWYDVQWHTAPGFNVVNLVRDDTGFRTITSKTYWGSQTVGSFVCRFGRTSGYACGTITQKDDIPACIPGARPFWVRVSVGAMGGDSGGPVYQQNSAYGTISCADQFVSIYDPVDFVESGVGVTVLTN